MGPVGQIKRTKNRMRFLVLLTCSFLMIAQATDTGAFELEDHEDDLPSLEELAEQLKNNANANTPTTTPSALPETIVSSSTAEETNSTDSSQSSGCRVMANLALMIMIIL